MRRHFIYTFVLINGINVAQAQVFSDLSIRSLDLKNQVQGTPIVAKSESFRIYMRSNNEGGEDYRGFATFREVNSGQILKQNVPVYVRPNKEDLIWVDTVFQTTGDKLVEVLVTESSWYDGSPWAERATVSLISDIDSDADSLFDYEDIDDDNDGVSDLNDQFPFDPSEWLDTDGDGQGNNIDSDDDNDGLFDFEEAELGTDPLDRDTDNDGINDKEDQLPTDGSESTDTDNDGIGDGADVDADNDGLSDEDEAVLGTDPLVADTDGDGVVDGLDNFPLDPAESADADNDGIGDNADPDDDNDGRSDLDEISLGTNPNFADTDGDGVNDSLDAFPLKPEETADNDNDGIADELDPDDDNDGLYDHKEPIYNSDVFNPDTDRDGLTDGDEVKLGTDPTDPDTDSDGVGDKTDQAPLDPYNYVNSDGTGVGDNTDPDDDNDGLSDRDEKDAGSDPLNPDSDNDGVNDGDEIDAGSDPLKSDSDEDGLDDAFEIAIGTDPNNWDSDNDGRNDFIEFREKTDPLVSQLVSSRAGDTSEAPIFDLNNLNLPVPVEADQIEQNIGGGALDSAVNPDLRAVESQIQVNSDALMRRIPAYKIGLKFGLPDRVLASNGMVEWQVEGRKSAYTLPWYQPYKSLNITGTSTLFDGTKTIYKLRSCLINPMFPFVVLALFLCWFVLAKKRKRDEQEVPKKKKKTKSKVSPKK